MCQVFIISRWRSGRIYFMFFENLLGFSITSSHRSFCLFIGCNIRMKLPNNNDENAWFVLVHSQMFYWSSVCPLRSMPHSIKVSFSVVSMNAYKKSMFLELFNRYYRIDYKYKAGCVGEAFVRSLINSFLLLTKHCERMHEPIHSWKLIGW